MAKSQCGFVKEGYWEVFVCDILECFKKAAKKMRTVRPIGGAMSVLMVTDVQLLCDCPRICGEVAWPP